MGNHIHVLNTFPLSSWSSLHYSKRLYLYCCIDPLLFSRQGLQLLLCSHLENAGWKSARFSRVVFLISTGLIFNLPSSVKVDLADLSLVKWAPSVVLSMNRTVSGSLSLEGFLTESAYDL